MRIKISLFSLTIYLFFGISLMFQSTSLIAQQNILDVKLNTQFQKMSVTNALAEISNKTNYFFIYKLDLLKGLPNILESTQNLDLRTCLFVFFQDTNLVFKQLNKHIIISKSLTKPIDIIENKKDTNLIISIEGKILDFETKQAIPYAVVSISGTSIGAIANAEGFFNLKLTSEFSSKDISLSHIGYKQQKQNLAQNIQNNSVYFLKRDIISLPEIIIRNHDPIKIISTFLKNINLNYPNYPSRISGFYREACSRNKSYYLISEGVVDIYKSAYNSLIDRDQIKVVKSRKVYNPEVADTLVMRLKAGLSSSLYLDLIHTIPDYLNPESFENYKYELDDISSLNNEAVYVINFEQKKEINEALYCGKLYISNNTMALLAADIQLNPKYIEKSRNDFVSKNKVKVKITPEKIRYRVEYRQINQKYFLSHVRGDLDFKVKKKKQIFPSNYHVFFELACSKLDTINAKHHHRKEIEDIEAVFSVNHNSYDPDFWGVDNIIEPEEPIENALRTYSEKMKIEKFH